MNEQELELLMRHLDGQSNAAENRRVNNLLREDAEARAMLRSIAVQATAMGDMASIQALESGSPRQPIPKNARWNVRWTWLAIAAALTLVVWIAQPWQSPANHTVAKVIMVSGDFFYVSGPSSERLLLKDHEMLSAGTLETDDDAASLMLEFRDGTSLTLSGGVELIFTDDGQKRLTLKHGVLAANVAPQPQDRPMLIKTPTAEVQVVGTVFNLTARPDDTLLRVDKGLVRLKRLADGQSVEVPPNNTGLASLDTRQRLDATVTPVPQLDWQFDFTTTAPPIPWRGIWRPVADGKSNLMTASTYVAKRHGDGTSVTHHGISVRTSYLKPPLRLLAGADTTVRFRIKLDELVPMSVMLLTNKLDGRYGGNFEVHFQPQELHPDEAGWCELEIPVSRFKVADVPKDVVESHPSAIGNILTCILVSSFQEDVHLMMSNLELQSNSRP
ncbi:hypothetical protein BH11VER1_BH11VER1_07840 [soil metagenome]